MVSIADKHLVIFGCGYVGSAVAHLAIEQGARVTALTRNPDKAAMLRMYGVPDVVVADLATDDWHRKIPAETDFILNSVSSGGGGVEGYRHSYVGGMRSILAWAAKAPRPVGAMIYTSSTSVYPQGDGAVVDESAEVASSTVAGQFLLEAESLLRDAPAAVIRRRIVLRLAGIYGPGRHHLLNQLRAGAEIMGGGTHRLNLAHRDDIVAAILACLMVPTAASAEVFNVADDAPAPKEEVIRWLAGQLGRPVPRFETVASPRRGSEPAPDRIISNAKLKTQLGWQPDFPSFREGYENLLSR